jgi:hypothetical protein
MSYSFSVRRRNAVVYRKTGWQLNVSDCFPVAAACFSGNAPGALNGPVAGRWSGASFEGVGYIRDAIEADRSRSVTQRAYGIPGATMQ